METLMAAGVTHCFVNTGTDYPAVIESWAKAAAARRPCPRIIVCPHEMAAISAAHGMSAVTGQPTAVFVHVDVGTQNLGGGVHNAARGRMPIVIVAGAAPFTLAGERRGSRDRAVQFLQDVLDQRGIVGPYVKWAYEAKTGATVGTLVSRAVQIAQAHPQGPVYLTLPREVLEEAAPSDEVPIASPVSYAPALPPQAVRQIVHALATSRHPLVITSRIGRTPEGLATLVRLADSWAVPVLEVQPQYLNFPREHELHQGFDSDVPAALAEADMVLAVDVDVPWVPAREGPRADARIFFIDSDPLKKDLGLWHYPATAVFQADGATAVQQILAALAELEPPQSVVARRAYWVGRHRRIRSEWARFAANPASPDGACSGPWVLERLARRLPPGALVLSEAGLHMETTARHLRPNAPGGWLTSGGSALGWGGGAAVGAKLAAPDRLVVLVTGDGSFVFGNPAAVYWMAKRYQASFLTVILNNHGWAAVRRAVHTWHPTGFAVRTGQDWTSLEPSGDWGGVATAAGGAWSATIREPAAFDGALDAALTALDSGRPAVLDVWVATPKARAEENT
jgi:acetolactate synthase-1/2/3 large subunit